MEREDWETAAVCAQCGSAVASGAQRGFEFGTSNLLCWNCALERGGRYDAERDTWTVPPDVADLPDEAYGATPEEARRPRS